MDSQEEVQRPEGFCFRATRGTVSPRKVAFGQKSELRKSARSVGLDTGRKISVSHVLTVV